ncbi:MAG TPA: hypothetical protein VNL14_03050 [Candidatus Acidoferrales bacterium]|nr:hypothetical protein [Candidatus Acidoferrales bacterium]
MKGEFHESNELFSFDRLLFSGELCRGRDQGYRNVTVAQQGFARWLSLRYPMEKGQ